MGCIGGKICLLTNGLPLNKALLNPYFWEGYVRGGVG